ncbi:fructose-1,6-bisphosphatase [Candidatus Sulfidibacterium hydrothermale]|uniref:fructose-1,6-bisphosphatase n=1 Tax=Candidatus Sulfidibacterium hydrothermale TaxID=2875962 RepID=UPI001F0AE859|nr:fructose-1,6-bisphosphatase [Candidatus Sulfidibacterium hydrothermale]UBM63378.1 fructose-1,6-bisphosphatase [Candidatus Sulfidibacterium hydrothermale]
MQKFDENAFPVNTLEKEIKYLRLLSDRFPNIQDASTEIINLEAILNLPKGTEHFLSDIHGEYETFSHVLANASGVVRKKIEDVFGKTLRLKDKRLLATLIYYPEEKLDLVLKEEEDPDEWFFITLQRLIKVARAAASKYTRSKVRKAMPPSFSYIIVELLNESGEDKEEYFEGIINTIIEIHRAEAFIIAICRFIQHLLIDRLHIIGDIFDRGPSAEKVMDRLVDYHSVDIQWGNHDILWMGAASGSYALIANMIRVSLRYNNLDTLEDAYGVNLLPLATFAMKTYKGDPCKPFAAKSGDDGKDAEIIRQMHKAISIIQFKLEGQVVQRNPHFQMDDRLLLDKIDYEKGTITLKGKTYELLDKHFPTIDPENPYVLTEEEQEVMEKLGNSIKNSQRLQNHIEFLFSHGSMYLTFNANLLYHGCIPMDDNGKFSAFQIEGSSYSGKALCDHFDRVARKAYHYRFNRKYETTADYLWYLWCGAQSPLFGKNKMATFERYFVAEKETHEEGRNPYYKLAYESEAVCNTILKEFGLTGKNSRIVNGHVPVKVKKGESPIKANGKLFVIDGGMSLPYQKVTGVAGYTLIYNSYGLVLVEHEHFDSKRQAVEDEKDIISKRIYIETNAVRKRVRDTDIGKELLTQISDLKMLLTAYRKGLIKERF